MFALAAVTRDDVANYVNDLLVVYLILILLYILSNMFFAFGGRPPYSRVLDAILTFLRDVSEPYLRIFRRFIPAVGILDLSPFIAIILLVVVRTVLVNLIQG